MTQSATETAEARFRSAFERLKAGRPVVLEPGSPVSQNNVAKEAGTGPTALKKKRYPTLVHQIQTYISETRHEKVAHDERLVRRRVRKEDLKAKVKTLQAQRDHAQSQLVSAQRRVLELLQDNATIKARLDDLLPAPTPLRK